MQFYIGLPHEVNPSAVSEKLTSAPLMGAMSSTSSCTPSTCTPAILSPPSWADDSSFSKSNSLSSAGAVKFSDAANGFHSSCSYNNHVNNIPPNSDQHVNISSVEPLYRTESEHDNVSSHDMDNTGVVTTLRVITDFDNPAVGHNSNKQVSVYNDKVQVDKLNNSVPFTFTMVSLTTIQLKGACFSPRWGLASAVLHDEVFVFGGYLWFHGVDGFFNDFYVINTGTSAIKRIVVNEGSQVPVARFGHTLVADTDRDRLILFGGRDSSKTLGDLWSYYPKTNTWRKECPKIREFESQNERDSEATDKGDNLDSVTDHTAKSKLEVQHNDVQSFLAPDVPSAAFMVDNNATTRKQTSPDDSSSGMNTATDKNNSVQWPGARSWHAAVVYNHGLYVCGGWDHKNSIFSDLWRLDLRSMCWTVLYSGTDKSEFDNESPVYSGRSCHNCAVWEGEMYVYGGIAGIDTTIGEMCAFSLESKTWRSVEEIGAAPGARTSAASVLMGDSWILHGGLVEYPREGAAAIKDLVLFNFKTQSWHSCPLCLMQDGIAASAARYGHSAVLIPNSMSLMLIGGAERYATATSSAIGRLDFVPCANFATSVLQQVNDMNRRFGTVSTGMDEIWTAATELQSQISSVSHSSKKDILDVRDRHDHLQSQIVSLQHAMQNLQGQVSVLQQSMSTFEQFVPMMRNFGAAIANFGTWQPQNGPTRPQSQNCHPNHNGTHAHC